MTCNTGTWSSNAFFVRDEGCLEGLCYHYNLEDVSDDERCEIAPTDDTGLFPGQEADEDGVVGDGGYAFFEELAGHLEPDPHNICVLMQVTRRGAGGIVGRAIAIRSPELGEPWMVEIDLDDIYDQAMAVFGLTEEPERVDE
jgi:hypothetical protein